MRKPARRKCAHCREWFHPAREGQVVCSFECASAIGKKQTAKVREAEKARAVKRQRESEKEGRQRRKARLAELRPNGYYKAQAQKAFNAYIALVMLLCHASVAARPTRLICMAASGTAATSKRSALTLSCVLKSATLISSANRAMPGPVSTPPKSQRLLSNTKLAWSLVTDRSMSTGLTAPTK